LALGRSLGLTITANIIMSLVIDHFGLFGITVHPLSTWRVVGAALMVGGIDARCAWDLV
jgi:bacterial/archaeal transporter family-2 protein